MSLTDGIVGCWSPSVRGSGYLLPDLSGRGNHGVLTNMDAGTDWPGAAVRGVHGRVLDFDGTNDHIRMRDSVRFAGNRMSFFAWVWFNVVTNAVIVNQGSTTNQFLLLQQSGWRVRGASSTEYIFGSTPSANSWIHVGFTANSTTATGYINGVQQTSGTIAAIAADQVTNLEFGSYVPFGGGFYLNGRLGETVMFRRDLAAGEVADLYRLGNGAIGRQLTGQTRRRVYGFVPAAGFKAYWARRQNQIIGGGV